MTPVPNSSLSASFSLYLEAVRAVSTLVVVLGHGKFFYAPVSAFCDRFHPGRDAVIAFFILSGYVISWCATERDGDWQRYALQRATRVYSVALPAVVFSLLAAVFIAAWNGTPPDYPLEKLWLYVPLYLGFLGNLWSLAETPPHNFPYWSLNFEVGYYVLFGALVFGRGWARWLLCAVVALVLGPAILALAPLWGAGVLLQRCPSPKLSQRGALAGVLITATTYVAVKVSGLDAQLDESLLGRLTTVGHDRLLGSYLVGLLFMMHLTAARCLQFKPPRWARCLRPMASVTFAVYLFHQPLFDIAEALWPRRGQGSLGVYAAVVASTLMLCAGIGWLTERQKRWYRDRLLSLAALLAGLAARSRRSAQQAELVEPTTASQPGPG